MSRFFGVNVPAKSTSNRNRAPFTAKQMVAKRALDLLLAGTALVILSPLLALICLGIKLEGRSPSMLLQRRAVFNGREFASYIFRTTAWEGASTGQGRRNDNRVTRVGHLLRATGLHELPQLCSVLPGHTVRSKLPVRHKCRFITRAPTELGSHGESRECGESFR